MSSDDIEAGGEPPCLMGLLDEQGQVPNRHTGAVPLIQAKRVYEPASASDGYRVLVDRLWPRGMTKEAAQIDRWMREVAPSDALRRWFGHDAERWDEFRQRYRHELSGPDRRDAVNELVRQARRGPLTLVYAARDPAHNDAIVLRDVLLSALQQEET